MATLTIKRPTELRTLILAALKEHPYRPVELLRELQNAEVTELALKDALAELIDAAIIELSPDRHIRLRQLPSAKSLAQP